MGFEKTPQVFQTELQRRSRRRIGRNGGVGEALAGVARDEDRMFRSLMRSGLSEHQNFSKSQGNFSFIFGVGGYLQ